MQSKLYEVVLIGSEDALTLRFCSCALVHGFIATIWAQSFEESRSRRSL
jgi:hypothetical protein